MIDSVTNMSSETFSSFYDSLFSLESTFKRYCESTIDPLIENGDDATYIRGTECPEMFKLVAVDSIAQRVAMSQHVADTKGLSYEEGKPLFQQMLQRVADLNSIDKIYQMLQVQYFARGVGVDFVAINTGSVVRVRNYNVMKPDTLFANRAEFKAWRNKLYEKSQRMINRKGRHLREKLRRPRKLDSDQWQYLCYRVSRKLKSLGYSITLDSGFTMILGKSGEDVIESD